MLPALKEFARRGRRRRRRKMNNSSSRLVQITHFGERFWRLSERLESLHDFFTSSTPSYRLKNGSKQCSRTGSAIAAILKLDSTLHIHFISQNLSLWIHWQPYFFKRLLPSNRVRHLAISGSPTRLLNAHARHLASSHSHFSVTVANSAEMFHLADLQVTSFYS